MEGSRPYIILNAAMSVDGKIATVTGDSKLSSEEDITRVHKMRSRVDAIMVGKNTVIRDDPLLTVRHTGGTSPIRVILDSSGSIPPESRIIKTCHQVPTIIAVARKIPAARLARLERLPVEVMMAGEGPVDLKVLMGMLYRRGIRTLLVEGGGTVNWTLVRDGLFDELYVTVSPFVLGGTGATSLVQGSGFGTIGESVRVRLISATRLGNHLVLYYKKL